MPYYYGCHPITGAMMPMSAIAKGGAFLAETVHAAERRELRLRPALPLAVPLVLGRPVPLGPPAVLNGRKCE